MGTQTHDLSCMPCCGGIETPCCPGKRLNDTLYATVTANTDCGCAGPTVVPGTRTDSAWSFPFACDDACGFSLTCNGTEVGDFELETGDGGPGAAQPDVGSTCDPLYLVFTGVSMCADGGCETADIVITA